MTLAVVERFTTLFVVITLHQMFEGLGLGARLANLSLPPQMRRVPLYAGILYAFITPAGLAIGLLVRKTYSQDSPTAIILSGILDALSAGVLVYTGLIELLASEFLFHQEMREAPIGKVLYALACVLLGAIIMAVLGIWA
jgi:zinc transporter 1/2/3